MLYSVYWVFIMRDDIIWNLAIKKTTHRFTWRYGILALTVLMKINANGVWWVLFKKGKKCIESAVRGCKV